MDVQDARARLGQVIDEARRAATELGIDKAFDAVCAASVSAGVVGAVRAAGKAAGKTSLRLALAHLGGTAGVAGGILTVAGIALSTYIATDQMMVDLGNIFIDGLMAQGVSVDDAVALIDRIPLSRTLSDSMRERAGAAKKPIEIDCEVE